MYIKTLVPPALIVVAAAILLGACSASQAKERPDAPGPTRAVTLDQALAPAPAVPPVAIEPNPGYPMPAGCTGELMPAMLHRFFAALNRGDAHGAFELLDPAAPFFDLGVDVVAFARAGARAPVVELRTEAAIAAYLAAHSGLHFTFTQPVEGGFGDPPHSVYIATREFWQVTSPEITAAGKDVVRGGGKGGVDCETRRLGLVIGPAF